MASDSEVEAMSDQQPDDQRVVTLRMPVAMHAQLSEVSRVRKAKKKLPSSINGMLLGAAFNLLAEAAFNGELDELATRSCDATASEEKMREEGDA